MPNSSQALALLLTTRVMCLRFSMTQSNDADSYLGTRDSMKPLFIAHYPENLNLCREVPTMENHTGAECNLLCFVRLKREWTIGGLALLKEGWYHHMNLPRSIPA